jgi:hypothetical protein
MPLGRPAKRVKLCPACGKIMDAADWVNCRQVGRKRIWFHSACTDRVRSVSDEILLSWEAHPDAK